MKCVGEGNICPGTSDVASMRKRPRRKPADARKTNQRPKRNKL